MKLVFVIDVSDKNHKYAKNTAMATETLDVRYGSLSKSKWDVVAGHMVRTVE